jgi:phosphoenolpyruvate synthase/pyruvate phosphate dikinase
VVAGIRTPQYLTKAARDAAGAKPLSMEEAMPGAYSGRARVFDLLETHYRDMQGIEFTVERGKHTRSYQAGSVAAAQDAGASDVYDPCERYR